MPVKPENFNIGEHTFTLTRDTGCRLFIEYKEPRPFFAKLRGIESIWVTEGAEFRKEGFKRHPINFLQSLISKKVGSGLLIDSSIEYELDEKAMHLSDISIELVGETISVLRTTGKHISFTKVKEILEALAKEMPDKGTLKAAMRRAETEDQRQAEAIPHGDGAAFNVLEQRHADSVKFPAIDRLVEKKVGPVKDDTVQFLINKGLLQPLSSEINAELEAHLVQRHNQRDA